MPFILVKGTFRPAAGTPDGDSVRFEPDDRDLMRSIPRVRMKAGARTVQLRYEGIDALEKHAIEPHAQNARDANLRLLGTTGAADPAGARGYILTREGDMKAGRPVCFVFAGEADEDDGTAVFLRSDRVRHSVNFQLLEAGMAYPLFYETLFKELRDEWNGTTLKGFLTWLDQNDDERVHTLSDHRFIGFQDVVEISAKTLRLLYPPQDLVFRPKPFGPSPN